MLETNCVVFTSMKIMNTICRFTNSINTSSYMNTLGPLDPPKPAKGIKLYCTLVSKMMFYGLEDRVVDEVYGNLEHGEDSS